MSEKLTAREFYYKHFREAKNYHSFQEDFYSQFLKVLQATYPDESRKTKIKEFIKEGGQFSNDLELDLIYEEILNDCNDDLLIELQEVFIIKDRSPNIEAFITANRTEYRGEFIFISLGLDMLINECSIQFELLKCVIGSNKLNKDRVSEIFVRRIRRFDKWIENWQDVAIIRQNLLQSYNDISTGIVLSAMKLKLRIFKYLLCHEIGHKVHKHLDGVADVFYRHARITSVEILSTSQQHQNEFHADLFALFLFSGKFKDRKFEINELLKFGLDEVESSLMLFTIIAQQDENIELDTESHPSFNKRYNNIHNIFTDYTNRKDQVGQLSVALYQRALYKLQNRGLGKVLKSEPWDELLEEFGINI